MQYSDLFLRIIMEYKHVSYYISNPELKKQIIDDRAQIYIINSGVHVIYGICNTVLFVTELNNGQYIIIQKKIIFSTSSETKRIKKMFVQSLKNCIVNLYSVA